MMPRLRKIDNNFVAVEFGDKTVWFSYETPIAFYTPKTGDVIRQNEWSTTTGKHLNSIDGGTKEAKARRVSSDEFNRALEEI